jgi:hypothetical protein
MYETVSVVNLLESCNEKFPAFLEDSCSNSITSFRLDLGLGTGFTAETSY